MPSQNNDFDGKVIPFAKIYDSIEKSLEENIVNGNKGDSLSSLLYSSWLSEHSTHDKITEHSQKYIVSLNNHLETGSMYALSIAQMLGLKKDILNH